MQLNESEEFAVLWTKAQPAVSSYVSAMVPHFHQAEDVLEQVVVTLVRKFDSYDRTRPFANWAIGITKNEVLKHRRKQATDKHVFCDELVEEITVAYEMLAPELEERRRLLHDCLEHVSGRARKVVQLRYFDDLKPAQVAERMKMESGAVRVLLHRVRSVIRKCIERRLPEI